jgi:hypothetical protein
MLDIDIQMWYNLLIKYKGGNNMGYSIEEKECDVVYDVYYNKTRVYTNDQKCMTKFKKANWKIVGTQEEDGKIIAMRFESEGFPITARDITKPKRKGNPNAFGRNA